MGLKCFFGRHSYELCYYKGIYGGQVACLKCTRCPQRVYGYHGKKAAKMIDAFIAKEKGNIVVCAKCNNELQNCECPDLEDRLDAATEGGHFAYKKCSKCGKHHARCRCEVPNFFIMGAGSPG